MTPWHSKVHHFCLPVVACEGGNMSCRKGILLLPVIGLIGERVTEALVLHDYNLWTPRCLEILSVCATKHPYIEVSWHSVSRHQVRTSVHFHCGSDTVFFKRLGMTCGKLSRGRRCVCCWGDMDKCGADGGVVPVTVYDVVVTCSPVLYTTPAASLHHWLSQHTHSRLRYCDL